MFALALLISIYWSVWVHKMVQICTHLEDERNKLGVCMDHIFFGHWGHWEVLIPVPQKGGCRCVWVGSALSVLVMLVNVCVRTVDQTRRWRKVTPCCPQCRGGTPCSHRWWHSGAAILSWHLPPLGSKGVSVGGRRMWNIRRSQRRPDHRTDYIEDVQDSAFRWGWEGIRGFIRPPNWSCYCHC